MMLIGNNGTTSTTASPATIASSEVVTAPASYEAAADVRNERLCANVPEVIESLPMETRFPVCHRLYRGFWLAETTLKHVVTNCTCFTPSPVDIFLVSLQKSGTTWLKALAFATLNRATHPPSDGQHPLRQKNPHDCVGFLELMMLQADLGARDLQVAAPASSPLLVATHIPYSLLPHAVTAQGSRCQIVYVCRDPKDVLVSYWNFHVKVAATIAATISQDRVSATKLTSFEEAFELFCEGRFPGGPHWLHALEYWNESQRRPNEVLFLRYEDMLGDPVGNIKRLAAFMGCPISAEEEGAGVVDQIMELCSLGNLKSMDVNKKGTTIVGMKNESFFRNGQAGDWKNYMTMEMAARLDKIVEEATRGSGLTFGCSILV